MAQHSCDAGESGDFVRSGTLDFFASHLDHTEQCINLLKQYLPLTGLDTTNIKKLEFVADQCIDNCRQGIKLIEDAKKRDSTKKLN